MKGQYPSTAYPVCGSDTIRQPAVPVGFTTSIPVPGCDKYADKNPFYYAFTCYAAGTLQFTITPNDPSDDYDWMLFDITGFLPSIIYTDSTLIVNGNRSALPGPTGAKSGGVSSAECNTGLSENISPFTEMPTLKKGHNYILLVSHTEPLQSGYSLAFGGSAEIYDPALPELLSVVVQCDKKTLTVGITKFVRCSSLASDGSDFVIKSFAGSVIKAIGLNCSPQFDFDYLEITVSQPLAPGNYSLIIQNGTDGNTLLDDCGAGLLPGGKINFTVPGVHPSLDSITPPVCSPSKLHLVFSSPVKCSSVATDGSDFQILGNSVVHVASAEGNCSGNLANSIDLTLTSPIVEDGNYQVVLATGTDGNTIVNECDSVAPAGSSISFVVKKAISASFDYSIAYGCRYDTINLIYLPSNGVANGSWYIDSVFSASSVSPAIVETVFGPKNVQHIVSNGICNDTVTKTVNLDNILQAGFKSPEEVCPKGVVSLSNTSIGNIISYRWDFGDGTTSTAQDPGEHLFPETSNGKSYIIRLAVQNNMGCTDTASAHILKLQSCAIGVPNAFTPNGDGKNDYLYPLNASSVTDLQFQVFNRYGQIVFETRDWSHKWDGTINGQPQSFGTYIWILKYKDNSGRKYILRGSTVLVR